MEALKRICLLALVLGSGLVPAAVQAQQAAIVSGVVTDAQDGQPLAGANVVLQRPGTTSIVAGAAAGADGHYRITSVSPGAYVLSVSFTGYRQAQFDLELAPGAAETVNAALEQGIELNPILVTGTPGGTPEKALDMPVSSSVLDAREIVQDVTPSSADVLRNTVGVDMAQTGVNRREMVLRGFNNAFSGATYVLTDYRHAAVPSLGVNEFTMMPIPPVDLERVEVIRGPASALYGAGVDAGVVHFFTKDPFTYPGTTLSLSGGERSLFAGQLRHAGVIGDRFGYKVSGHYTQADDWALNPADPHDRGWIEREGPRRDDHESYNVNGLIQYRINDRTTLSLNGGHSSLTGVVLSGIGTVQGAGFGYSYGQLRLRAGNFFAQAYVNRNDAGDSFVYGTGNEVVDKGMLYNAQAQYDLHVAGGRQQFIMGVDAELTRPNTDGTILGRNEDDDAIDEYGAYVQSSTALTPQLDLTLALRGDYNNIIEEVRLSPRAALVFKATPQHSIRATYNRAFTAPGTNSLFLDIVAGQIPGTDITLRGRGAAFGYTFERNPAFEALAGSDLVASSLIPGMEGAPQPVGLPLDLTYNLVYQGIVAIPIPMLTGILNRHDIPVDEEATEQLVALLSPQAGTNVQGFSRGALAMLNPSAATPEERFMPVSDAVDIAPLKQPITQTIELGYKGLIANRVLFTVDAYYTTKENFIGPLLVETPFVFVPTLAPDLTGALTAGIAGNAPLAEALLRFGVTPEQAAGLIVGLAGSQLPGATTPVAIVQPRENNPGAGNTPELLLTYRNFGRVQFYGADISTQVLLTDNLSVFGNLSLVSDDFFDNEELDEENVDLAVALNAPKLKAKVGYAYSVPGSVSFNMAGRYTEGFPVRSGPYVGELESYFLLDVGAGYDFVRYAPGLRLDVTVQNVLDNDHREFIGAPKLGRLAMARMTYTF